MVGGLFSFVLFYSWDILLLGYFFVVVGFSICAGIFDEGNFLGLPIILAGPNLGKKHKKGNLSKVSLIALGPCFKPIVEFRFGLQPNYNTFVKGKKLFHPSTFWVRSPVESPKCQGQKSFPFDKCVVIGWGPNWNLTMGLKHDPKAIGETFERFPFFMLFS